MCLNSIKDNQYIFDINQRKAKISISAIFALWIIHGDYITVNGHTFFYLFSKFSIVWCRCLQSTSKDCRHSYTNIRTHTTFLQVQFPNASENKARAFPWYGAISSSNKKPASLAERSSLVSPIITLKHEGGQAKTRGISFTGYHSHTLTHTPTEKVQRKHTHVNQAFQTMPSTPEGLSYIFRSSI